MKIREVYEKERKSYASHTPEAREGILDCSQGVNPYGPPAQALEAVRAFDPGRLGNYPHTHAAHDAIIRYWSGQAALRRENILLVDGSVSALYLINQLFARPGAKVVGFYPSFTDMIVNVDMQGMEYAGVPPRDGDYREDVESLLAAMDENTSLVYIDNPNNPTGQLLSREELAPVLKRARELGAYVLIDEAYGDFVGREASVLPALPENENLLVLRTFSKGFGLAGLRAGYVLASEKLVEYLGKTTNPYAMGELTREAAAAAMEAPDHPAAHAAYFAEAKRRIRESVGGKLSLLRTDGRVPICTLCHREDVDLQAALYEKGILTVSGEEFDCMGRRFVRLSIPREEDAQRLLDAVRQVDGGR